jgi:hypothetical protein
MAEEENVKRLEREIIDLEHLLEKKKTEYTFLTNIGPLVLKWHNCYPDLLDNTFTFREHNCYRGRKEHIVKNIEPDPVQTGKFTGPSSSYERNNQNKASMYFHVNANYEVLKFGWTKTGPRFFWSSKRRVYLCNDIDCPEAHEFEAADAKKRPFSYSDDSRSEGARVYPDTNDVVDMNVWDEKDHNAKKYVRKRWWRTRSRVKEKSKKMKVRLLRSLR